MRYLLLFFMAINAYADTRPDYDINAYREQQRFYADIAAQQAQRNQMQQLIDEQWQQNRLIKQQMINEQYLQNQWLQDGNSQ
jgi:hypothetical protein